MGAFGKQGPSGHQLSDFNRSSLRGACSLPRSARPRCAWCDSGVARDPALGADVSIARNLVLFPDDVSLEIAAIGSRAPLQSQPAPLVLIVGRGRSQPARPGGLKPCATRRRVTRGAGLPRESAARSWNASCCAGPRAMEPVLQIPQAVQRVRGVFLEMPGTQLSLAQAARLAGLER